MKQVTGKTLLLFILAVLTSALMFGFGTRVVFAPEEPADFLASFEVSGSGKENEVFPVFSYTDMTGKKRSIEEYKGKFVLVNFWALWCAPCVEEIPSLLRLEEKREGEDFEVVFISLDFPENIDDMKIKLGRFKLPDLDTWFTNDQNLMKFAGNRGLPMTVILNRQGEIMYTLLGDAVWDSPKALRALDGLMASSE